MSSLVPFHVIFRQVQAPFETRPGEIPRRIQIERKRRLYLQHRIEDLLLERGVDHAQPPKSALAFLSPSIRPMPVEVLVCASMITAWIDAALRLSHLCVALCVCGCRKKSVVIAPARERNVKFKRLNILLAACSARKTAD